MSEYFRTQYEKCYEGDEYYWGLEPASFLDISQIGRYIQLKRLFLKIIVVA